MAEQVDLGLGYKDWTRIVWTFLMAAGAVALAAGFDWINGQPFTWRTVLIGAIAAGLSAIKNFVLADGSTLK